MQSSAEILLPKDSHMEIIYQSGGSRLFAQTSSWCRSQSYLVLFKHLTQANKEEDLKKILIDLYLNCSLLLKEGANTLLPDWITCLEDFRQLHTISCINRLLASAILVVLHKNKREEECFVQYKEQFNAILKLTSMQWPHLANSVLAAMAQALEDNVLYESCLREHSVTRLLEINDSEKITVQDAEMIILPFTRVYEDKGYVSSVISQVVHMQARCISRNVDTSNYYRLIHALLKIMPQNDSFWLNPSMSVPLLIAQLKPSSNYMFTTGIVELLVTIQSRITDKEFLTKYHDMLKYLGLCETIDVVRVASETSDETIMQRFEEYNYPFTNSRQFPSESYFGRLKDKKNIMSVIDKLLLLPLIKNNYYAPPISRAIESLLAKIDDESFLSDYMSKLYDDGFTIQQDRESYINPHLISVCRLPQLSDKTRLFHLDELFNFHKEKECTILTSDMMKALCASITSANAIESWLEKFGHYTIDCLDKPELWFQDCKNRMYFTCYLLLLSKSTHMDNPTLEKEMILYIDKLFKLFNSFDNALRYDSYQCYLADYLPSILFNIKSKDLLVPYLENICSIKSSYAWKFITPFLLSVNNEAIEKTIDSIVVQLGGCLKDRAHHEALFDDISLLLVKLPHSLSQIIADSLFKVEYKETLIPKHIKDYIEGDGLAKLCEPQNQ